MKRVWIATAIVAVLVLVNSPYIVLTLDASGDLPDGGLSPAMLRIDVQGDITGYHPGDRWNQMPLRVQFHGHMGEAGHVAYGVFNMAKDTVYRDVRTVGVEVSMRSADVLADLGMIRASVASQWIVGDRHYYLEFDFWGSDGTTAVFPGSKMLYYEQRGTMPTAELLMDRLAQGEEGVYHIDLYKEFERVWRTSGQLNAVYIVVEKTSDQAVFDVSFDVPVFKLYA